MARRLLNHGHRVQGFDLVSKVRGDFEKSGGEWLEDLRGIQADLIFSMLPGGPQVKKLYLEDQNFFSQLRKGTLVVDCSTADPKSVFEVYKEAEKKEIGFLSTPVSGGTKGAKEGNFDFYGWRKKRGFKKSGAFA